MTIKYIDSINIALFVIPGLILKHLLLFNDKATHFGMQHKCKFKPDYLMKFRKCLMLYGFNQSTNRTQNIHTNYNTL